jgi:hypothetical protein
MISDMNIPRKRNIKMRYIGAISDTDILINLAKVNRLDVLDYLFKKIIILQYVYDFEIKKKAGRYYSTINHAINKDGSIFRVLDRKKDKSINILAKDIIEEMRKVYRPEKASGRLCSCIKNTYIISDKYTEFKWKMIYNINSQKYAGLCVYFGDNEIVNRDIFNQINGQLSNPTPDTFEDQYRKAMKRCSKNSWKHI